MISAGLHIRACKSIKRLAKHLPQKANRGNRHHRGTAAACSVYPFSKHVVHSLVCSTEDVYYILTASSCAVQELQVEIADWHQIKRIRPSRHMRRTVMPDLSVDKVCFLYACFLHALVSGSNLPCRKLTVKCSM